MLILATLLLSGAAQADAAPSAAAAKPQCRRMESTTGSNMPGKRVCHSKAEWAAIDHGNSENVRTFTGGMDRGMGTNGGPS